MGGWILMRVGISRKRPGEPRKDGKKKESDRSERKRERKMKGKIREEQRFSRWCFSFFS